MAFGGADAVDSADAVVVGVHIDAGVHDGDGARSRRWPGLDLGRGNGGPYVADLTSPKWKGWLRGFGRVVTEGICVPLKSLTCLVASRIGEVRGVPLRAFRD